MQRFTWLLALYCCGIHLAHAEADIAAFKFPDKLTVKLGGYFIDDRETEILVNSSDNLNIGTRISMQQDLAMGSRAKVPRIDGYYRFNSRHRLDFSWYNFDMDGETILESDIEFDDEIFESGLKIKSSSRINIAKLAYMFSFYKNPKVELGISAGVFINDFKFKLDAESLDQESLEAEKSEDAKASLKLPVLGFSLRYNISPRWSFDVITENFYLDYDDARGSFNDTRAFVEHRTFTNVAFGLGINSYVMNVLVNDDDYRGEIIESFRGFLVYTSIYF